MVEGAERETGAVFASREDLRITRVGHLLRRTRIDELPQFWNVLKGDMSIVGPRPERPEFLDEISERFPYFRVRSAFKPGVTGWAQVRNGYVARHRRLRAEARPRPLLHAQLVALDGRLDHVDHGAHDPLAARRVVGAAAPGYSSPPAGAGRARWL